MNLPELRKLLAALTQDSVYAHTAYFAGGCVRDYASAELFAKQLSSAMPNDVDITVELPNGGIRLAEFLLPHFPEATFSTHHAFGTAKLQMQDYCLEFVGTRKENYLPHSRYPQISLGSLLEDIMRRDFSINALLMRIDSGELIDICGKGLSDLRNGIIRSLGVPKNKFREDPLRMLRALRFSLRFGFAFEETTLAALISEAKLLDTLSTRRIKHEISLMLHHSDASGIRASFTRLGWQDNAKLLSLLLD